MEPNAGYVLNYLDYYPNGEPKYYFDGDIDESGLVNWADFVLFANDWLKEGYPDM